MRTPHGYALLASWWPVCLQLLHLYSMGSSGAEQHTCLAPLLLAHLPCTVYSVPGERAAHLCCLHAPPSREGFRHRKRSGACLRQCDEHRWEGVWIAAVQYMTCISSHALALRGLVLCCLVWSGRQLFQLVVVAAVEQQHPQLAGTQGGCAAVMRQHAGWLGGCSGACSRAL